MWPARRRCCSRPTRTSPPIRCVRRCRRRRRRCAAADGSAVPFWQVGYGYVDLGAAVSLVRSGNNWAKDLARAQSRADARVLAADGIAVQRSDFWTYDAPRVAVGGSDHRTYATAVPIGVTRLKVTLSHPSGAVVGENLMNYTVTVRDAAGQLLGTTTEAPTGAGTASVLIDLGPVPGRLRCLHVRGQRRARGLGSRYPGQRVAARTHGHPAGSAAAVNGVDPISELRASPRVFEGNPSLPRSQSGPRVTTGGDRHHHLDALHRWRPVS